MADTTRIAGYQATILKIGYIFSEEVPYDMWEVAAYHEIDGSRLINVENAIDALETKRDEEPLSEAEQKLLAICTEAEAKGIGDIVINPP